MKRAIDCDEIAFSRIFALFELRHNFLRCLWLRSRHQAINDLLALASDLDFMLLHFRKNSGFRSGFVREFGVFLHAPEDSTLKRKRQGAGI